MRHHASHEIVVIVVVKVVLLCQRGRALETAANNALLGGLGRFLLVLRLKQAVCESQSYAAEC